MIEEASAGFPFDQQIEIACVAGFAASHGTENTNITRAMLRRQPEHLLALLVPQRVHGHHVSIVRQKGEEVTGTYI
jgi:hypothetical protein